MDQDNVAVYQNLKTLTGLTIQEALTKLQARLEPQAYSQVEGGSGKKLTDIKPAWLTEALTYVFGLCGVGWSFGWENIELSGEMTKTKSGYDRYVWQADILNGWLSYILTDGPTKYEFKIKSTGGSDNDVKEYAVRGAVTNMIGAAASKLLWQLPIYKGQADAATDKTPKPAAQPAKAVDPQAPWYRKALDFAKSNGDDWNKPLGATKIGQRTIQLLSEQVGPDKWFMAKPHVEQAVKKYTGFGKAEEMTWPSFERLVRAYAGPLALPGEQVKDVLFGHYLKAAEWQALVGAIPLEPDMVLDEETASALDAAITGSVAYKKDGKFDHMALADSLRRHFVKTAVDEGPVDVPPLDETEAIQY